ncbi:MAG: 30S ribosomal protein THX [Flammeovirgaceae bacterium]
MGRGDKKSKKGKISMGTYGNSRKKKTIKARLKRSASKKKVAAGAKEKTKRTSKKA